MLRQGRERALPQLSRWLLQRCLTSSPAAQRMQRLQDPPAPAPAPPAGPRTSPKEDLVAKLLGAETRNRSEARRERLRAVRAALQRFPGDVGSSEVQVGALTERILAMAEHMQTHRKDFSSRRGLEAMLNRRRRLLIYLRRSNFERYAFVLSSLGLKDTFFRQDRLTQRMASKRAGR